MLPAKFKAWRLVNACGNFHFSSTSNQISDIFVFSEPVHDFRSSSGRVTLVPHSKQWPQQSAGGGGQEEATTGLKFPHAFYFANQDGDKIKQITISYKHVNSSKNTMNTDSLSKDLLSS